MMKLLISVRSVEEAAVAADGGADFIDLKEPGRGALGGLPIAVIGAIVAALRQRRDGTGSVVVPVSATIGDLSMHAGDEIAARVDAVGACGVDYVKVGIERMPMAREVLSRLAGCGWPVVPVFIADRGIDIAQVEHACALGFPGVMADTADKLAGSLFDLVPPDDLRRFVAVVRASGAMVGLAGALRLADAARLAELAPDFAGFRSAVCAGDRASALDAQRLRLLVASMRAPGLAAAACG